MAESLLNSSLVGLSVLYLMQGGDALQWCIRQSSEVENMMISVERIQQYVGLAPEAELESKRGLALKEKGWPAKGAITLNGVGVKYGKDESIFALRNASAVIPAGTKVALVGRTGSGKSTLLSALFRLVEAEEGNIQIDDVNLKDVGLHESSWCHRQHSSNHGCLADPYVPTWIHSTNTPTKKFGMCLRKCI